MSEKTEFLDLYKALAKFQTLVPEIEKRCVAKAQTFSYKYADLPDIKRAIKPALEACNLVVSNSTIYLEKTEFLVTKVILTTSGEFVQSLSPLHSGMKPQEKGALITYLRRYHLCGLLDIAADEDVDGLHTQPTQTIKTNAESKENTSPLPRPVWAPKTEQVMALAEEKKKTEVVKSAENTTYTNKYITGEWKFFDQDIRDAGKQQIERYLNKQYDKAKTSNTEVSNTTKALNEAFDILWGKEKKTPKIEVVNVDSEPPLNVYDNQPPMFNELEPITF
jgi:hypothetical protein